MRLNCEENKEETKATGIISSYQEDVVRKRIVFLWFSRCGTGLSGFLGRDFGVPGTNSFSTMTVGLDIYVC